MEVGDVSCAPYVSTSPEVVHRMLELAKIISNDVVYDLGCGDGRILIAAVKDFNAKGAIGYEINPSLFKNLSGFICLPYRKSFLFLYKGTPAAGYGQSNYPVSLSNLFFREALKA